MARLRAQDRKRLEAFVRARVAEQDDPAVRSAHEALLRLIDRMRREAAKEADWDWIEGFAVGILGDDDWGDDLAEDALFGDDPEREAARIATAILAALALAHTDHPDYETGWSPRRR